VTKTRRNPAAPWSLNAAGKFPLPSSARSPDHREPTQRGLASAVHFEVTLALASAAPMTETGKIDNRTRREFTLIGIRDRASANEQIRQICVHGARRLLDLSAGADRRIGHPPDGPPSGRGPSGLPLLSRLRSAPGERARRFEDL